MAVSERIQNVLIAGLAAVAVGASAYAVWSVNRPYPAAEGTGVTAAPVSTQDPATTMSTGRSGSTTEAQEATASPEDGEASVTSWVEAWSGDGAELLVVGDGFSNLPSQWVQLWATAVGQDRPVTLHHWGEAADVSFNDPILLSDGEGPTLTVWSASRDGTTVHAAAQHYPRFVEASATPDAVLVTLGRSSTGEDVADGLDQLVGEIDEDVPVLVSIGPEGLYGAGIGDALLEWSQEHDDRVAVVDLRGEAPDTASAEQWAAAFRDALGDGS